METFFVATTWEGATGIWCVEARVAANHLPKHRTVATTKNYLAPPVNSTKAEKHHSKIKALVTPTSIHS